MGATTAVANAKEAAKKAVKECQCKAWKAVSSAHASKSSSVVSSNNKAWEKAAHLRCVLKGTSPSQCKVPSMPTLTVPKMACGAATTTSNLQNGWSHYGGSYWQSMTQSKRD